MESAFCSIEHGNAGCDPTAAIVPAGTLLPAEQRELGVRLSCLFGDLLGAPVKVCTVDPHPMHAASPVGACDAAASFLATATFALRMPLRLAIRMPQALSVDQPWTRVSSTLAAA